MHGDRGRQLAVDAVEKGGVEMQGPQRERGLWSFLTWSFFLSQLAVGNAFAAGAAQAGSGIDVNAPGNATNSESAGTAPAGVPDFRVLAAAEPETSTTPSSTAQSQSSVASDGGKTGGIDQLDMTSDASLAMQAAGAYSSAAVSYVSPAAENAEGGAPSPEPLAGVAIDIEPPAVLSDVLSPVLGTVDDLLEGLGPTLDGLLVPIVETVDDFASVLGPTLDHTLSSIETLADGIVDGLQPTLDSLFAPIAGLGEGVSELIEPAGAVAGEIMALADPVIDAVQPALSSLTNVVAAAQPILEPVVEILPLNVGNGGLLDGIFDGSSATDTVASAGMLEFADDAGASGHDLFHAGSYTEYGIALHETSSGLENGVNDLLDDVAAPIGDLLVDNDDGNSDSLPTILGSLQHEIGLRGLGEGLI